MPRLAVSIARRSRPISASAIGVVIMFGVTAALLVTLILVPAAYSLLARRTGSPRDVERRLAKEELDSPVQGAAPAE